MATGYYNVQENDANKLVTAALISPIGVSDLNFDGAYDFLLRLAESNKAPLYSTTLDINGPVILMGSFSIKVLIRSVSAVGIFSDKEDSIWVVSATAKKDAPDKLIVKKVAL